MELVLDAREVFVECGVVPGKGDAGGAAGAGKAGGGGGEVAGGGEGAGGDDGRGVSGVGAAVVEDGRRAATAFGLFVDEGVGSGREGDGEVVGAVA